LKQFKLKYLGVSAQEGQDYFARLSQLRAMIDAAKVDLEAAEQSRDAYKRELAGETATFLPESVDVRTTEAMPEINARVAALQRALDDLLRKYTEEHPDVVATRRLIANLQQQRDADLAARKKAARASSPTASNLETNPVFQQLKISLADAEADVASARAKVAGYEAQYRQLQARAQLVPEAEAEYAQLTRDYEVQKRTYESLLARREAAGMGMDVQDTGGARFRVIDPPRVSPEPVAPTRVTLLDFACIASLGAGLVASLVASELRPILQDAQTLRELSNRPVLGMVSMLPSRALTRLRRRSAYLFAGALGGLLVSLTGVVAFVLLFGRVA